MTDKQHGLHQGSDGFEDRDSMSEGAQAEAWQEDQPPVDDFHDQSDTEVAAALDAADTAATDQATKPDSKSGMKVMAITILVGAALIGGLLYLQFGGSSEPGTATMPIAQAFKMPQNLAEPAAAPAPNAPPAAPVIPKVGEVTVVDPGTTAKTSSADITSLYAAGQAKDAVALPMPQPTEDGIATTPATAEPAKDAPAATDAPSPFNPSPAPSAQMAKIEPSMAPLPAPVAPLSPVTPPSTTPAPANNAQLDALTTKFEDLKKAFDQLSQQNAQLAARVEASAHAQAPAMDPQLERRMAMLEKKLDILTDRPASIEAPSIMPPTISSAEVAAPHETAKSKPSARTTNKKHATTTKKPPATKRSTTKATAPQPAAPTHAWMLRAATPDAAWIAKDAKATELTKVKVGDNVEGIGQVESITQLGEGWVVVGSKGAIH
ncbi:hypothetical protein [Propionivibrio sp.]|uniref:hypothetical protein n=1 Tax=Propionivibrio sp. TaxID=2212460 RepID=UPI00262A0CE9|nr:hypothetical protein [Propionivibrio sp.]